MADCYFCGAPIPEGSVYRTTLCGSCGRELKICYNCRFYDPGSPNACREPVAEAVRDKDRANFCDQFSAGPNSQARKKGTESPSGRKAFESLFGNE